MTISEEYDSSWDLVKNEKGNLPTDDDAYNRIYSEWKTRKWKAWLNKSLEFPFLIKRVEDEGDAYFTDIADDEPFKLGHEMKALKIEAEDKHYGVILKVREGRRVGYVPLCDVEVSKKDIKNFWPVREYTVWYSNR